MKSHIVALILFSVLVCTLSTQVEAQDLEPRLLSPVPTGGNFAIASYAYSNGNILLDNTLPIEDLNASISSIVAAYARSFKLFHKLAKFDVVVPYAFGNYEAIVDGLDTSATKHGFGDPMFRISMILIGKDPLSPADYFKQEQKKFDLGASVRVRPPLGQYDPTKLLNLGSNRWSIYLNLAGSYRFGRKFVLEGHLYSIFFTENSSFYNGNTLRQKPLLATQLHATYIFKPGIWVAASFGRTFLGETELNGVEQENLQKSSRSGLAFAYRLNKNNALKFAFTTGITARYGTDFTTFVLAYQRIWFDKAR